MRYCACGEDGMEVLECWKCGRSKCEDCATRREVEDQHCNECRAEEAKTSSREIIYNSFDRPTDASDLDRPATAAARQAEVPVDITPETETGKARLNCD